MDKTRISKFLSFVLRHHPDSIGLVLDEAGWVSVDDLLRACKSNGKTITLGQLTDIVESNDKKRFAFSADGKMIRASQGHSVAVELAYSPQQPPSILYHGTACRFIPSIKQTGLEKRDRHHVHLTESRDSAAVVGKRHGKLVLLSINAASMHEDGHTFFLSSNHVWLTDHVPVKYIEFPSDL